jgi:hypothetical protein
LVAEQSVVEQGAEQRVTHRIAVDGAEPSRARLPEAKRADQGGVAWGNPSDAFLILGRAEAFPMNRSCPENKNAAGNCAGGV